MINYRHDKELLMLSYGRSIRRWLDSLPRPQVSDLGQMLASPRCHWRWDQDQLVGAHRTVGDMHYVAP